MRQIKKLFSFILALMLIFMLPFSAQAVGEWGSLSYWYEDQNREQFSGYMVVGRFPSKNISFGYKKLNTNSKFYFNDGVIHAKDQWRSGIGVNLTQTLIVDNADIKIYGGKYQELKAIGLYLDYPYEDITPEGSTDPDYDIADDYYLYQGNPVRVVRLTDSTIAIIERSNKSRENYLKTITHEFGHALGWIGHSHSTNLMMYTSSNVYNNINLSIYDKRHLKQIYDGRSF